MSKLAPFPFQEADLVELYEHDFTGFVVAETGAGKTLTAIEAGLRSPATRILVIAVKSTIEDTWTQGILNQDPTATIKRIDGTAEGRAALDEFMWGFDGWYIVTHAFWTKTEWSGADPHLTILDEAHLLANHEGKGGKKLMKFPSRRKIAMSGTLVRNKFENLWTLLRWVHPDRNGVGDIADISRNRWIRDNCDWKSDVFTPNGMDVRGELVPGDMAKRVPCYIQHFKRDECCEFHPEGFLEGLEAPIEIRHVLDLTPGQKKAIKTMQNDYVAYLETLANERDVLIAKLPIVARIRLRQMTLALPKMIPGVGVKLDRNGQPMINPKTGEEIMNPDEVYFDEGAESPKIDKIVEIMSRDDDSALILTSSAKIIPEVLRRLKAAGVSAEGWSGEVNDVDRQARKRRFIAGETRALVAVISSIGTGTDGLQFATNRLIWMEESDDITDNIQGEGRLDRRGQTRQVVNIKLIAKGSMDQQILDTQLIRRLNLNASLRRKRDQEKRSTAA